MISGNQDYNPKTMSLSTTQQATFWKNMLRNKC